MTNIIDKAMKMSTYPHLITDSNMVNAAPCFRKQLYVVNNKFMINWA